MAWITHRIYTPSAPEESDSQDLLKHLMREGPYDLWIEDVAGNSIGIHVSYFMAHSLSCLLHFLYRLCLVETWLDFVCDLEVCNVEAETVK